MYTSSRSLVGDASNYIVLLDFVSYYRRANATKKRLKNDKNVKNGGICLLKNSDDDDEENEDEEQT